MAPGAISVTSIICSSASASAAAWSRTATRSAAPWQCRRDRPSADGAEWRALPLRQSRLPRALSLVPRRLERRAADRSAPTAGSPKLTPLFTVAIVAIENLVRSAEAIIIGGTAPPEGARAAHGRRRSLCRIRWPSARPLDRRASSVADQWRGCGVARRRRPGGVRHAVAAHRRRPSRPSRPLDGSESAAACRDDHGPAAPARQHRRSNFGAIEALRGVSFDIAPRRGGGACSATTAPASRPWSRSSPAAWRRPPAGSCSTARSGNFSSPAEAKAAGIETVYQDLSLCTNVDVVANFFMGREIVKRYFGIPILQEARHVGGRREGDGQRRHTNSLAAHQCRASLRRPAPGHRAQPLRPLGRQAGAARRALRRPGRRADAARP